MSAMGSPAAYASTLYTVEGPGIFPSDFDLAVASSAESYVPNDRPLLSPPRVFDLAKITPDRERVLRGTAAGTESSEVFRSLNSKRGAEPSSSPSPTCIGR